MLFFPVAMISSTWCELSDLLTYHREANAKAAAGGRNHLKEVKIPQVFDQTGSRSPIVRNAKVVKTQQSCSS